MHKVPLDVVAEVRDLKQRLHALESIFHGQPTIDLRGSLLIRMYLEAHRVPEFGGTLSGMAIAEGWVRQSFLLDRVTLITLGREVNDPFPWRPFLVLLDRCASRNVPGAMEARQRLMGLAQELLDLAGLEVLQPRDVLGSLRIEEAISAISM
jgi:hypothetical protein